MQYYIDIFDNAEMEFSNEIVAHGKLEGSPFLIITGNDQYLPNYSISVMVLSHDKEKINRYYKQLIRDGKELMPLDSYPFSEWYAWVVDKYGFSWQLYTAWENETIEHHFVPVIMFAGKQQGNCRKALELFKNVFPEFTLSEISEYPEGKVKGQVMHSRFKLNQNVVMAMDSGVEQDFNFNETISMVIECDDQKAIDHYWDGLIENGGEASKCGWLKDRFGMSWQIAPRNFNDLLFKSGNERAIENMMKMEKIILKDLL